MRRLLAAFLLIAAPLSARVISYAPYSDRITIPAMQHRLNRHFVLYETTPANATIGQIVVYDTLGLEEPRVALNNVNVGSLAAREDDQQFAILVQGTSPSAGMLSVDGGRSWKNITLPSSNYFNPTFNTTAGDTGGSFARGRYSQVRVGTRQYPFYFASSNPAGVYAIAPDGSIKTLYTTPQILPIVPPQIRLLGTSLDGANVLFLVDNVVVSVDTSGITRNYATLPATTGGIVAEGWITSDFAAYVEEQFSSGTGLYYLKNGTTTFINGAVSAPPPPNVSPAPSTPGTFYAVPAGDYDGAWMILRDASKSTILFSHTAAQGLVKRWEDITAPEVEALHPARSNTKVLIQVHRSRITLDQALFKDPALAVWHVGDPAPKSYDELFLQETVLKGFVHVDVDKIENGEPFVFDSGAQVFFFPPGPIVSPAPPGAGGSDVVQEWGVVRASLMQRLVLPGAARTAGAFGSFWSTDVTFYNPSDAPQTVQVHYAANGNTLTIAADNSRSVTLGPREIRTIPDILKNLFLFESGIGALYIVPGAGQAVNVTSRTYTQSDKGTFGFGMNAIDVFAAASPRFPVTFSGAFLGANFRTNLVLTDVSGRGSEAGLLGWGPFGPAGNGVTSYTVPSLGQQQFNFVNAAMAVGANDTGALVVTPTRGEAVASVFAIDNRTNDSTYFPPDLPASVVRVIPAIGHLDGANGSKFRTDLYLFNNSDSVKFVTLQAKVWDASGAPSSFPLTLLPREARTIPDVLKTAFNLSGIARLRYFQQGTTSDTAVRVTSRTYTVDDNGGTYGFLMPPLNSFQSGAPGDTLEILGASLDKRFRTNLGLVDLTPFLGSRASRANVAIIDDQGKQLDSFEITRPILGGNQINDLFHARNLPESATPVLLRVTVIEGSVGAYAAVVDNGTNDPAYFAANLAAKQ
ncbi:MAG TPA: hypothetical protein VJZ76_19150 [Thermoanaerobaculia bacterium]|nr:hypothetical protein [Thermoanaerobaculia bacterium]